MGMGGGYEFDRSKLLKHLPYGPNFLFLDSAFVCRDFQTAEGVYTVPRPEEHPILKDHFPGLSIFPGNLQVEGAAQLAALLVMTREKERAFYENRLAERLAPLLVHPNVALNTFAVPGDSIEYRASVAQEHGRDICFTVHIVVRGNVSSGTLSGKIVPFKVLERMARRSLCG